MASTDFQAQPPEDKELKPEDIKIVDFKPLVVPNLLNGGVNVIVFGMGDDGNIYTWLDGKWTI